MIEARKATVIEAIVDVLSESTPSPLFALMGDGNQELIVAFANGGRQIIKTRHEQNAPSSVASLRSRRSELGTWRPSGRS